MGKIKVSELAKKVNMTEDAIIKKLKAIAIDVKSGEDLVDEALAQRFSANAGPHIIRRKVKVVTTDDQGNKVEKITTNAGGTIHQSVVREKKQEKPTYSKEGLGVVKSNRSRNNRNVMQNIVVTQNGKKVEPKAEQKIEKPVEKVYDRPEVSVADAKRIVNNFAEQREQRINERREQNAKNINNNQNKFQKNNNNGNNNNNFRPNRDGENKNFNRGAKPGDRQSGNRPDFKNRNQNAGQSTGYTF